MTQRNNALSQAFRYLQILEIIRKGGSWSSSTLMDALKARGIEVSKRTIQRDLEKIRQVYPQLERLGNAGQYTWRWSRSSPAETSEWTPGLAIAFHLASVHLKRLLPPSVQEDLQPYFEKASEYLSQTNNALGDWHRKVVSLSPTIVQSPPEVSKEILHEVYTAVLTEKPLHIVYRNRSAEKKEGVISPLGIVVLDKITYLVGCFWNYQDIRRIALHRITDARIDESQPFNKPPNFDPEQHLTRDAFQYSNTGEKIELVLLVDYDTAYHLYEMPLSDDQKMVYLKEENKYQVTATVIDSENLRWWILGQGEHVVILHPSRLKKEIMDKLNKISGKYRMNTHLYYKQRDM